MKKYHNQEKELHRKVLNLENIITNDQSSKYGTSNMLEMNSMKISQIEPSGNMT